MHFARLEEAQQLGLHVQANLADFVEEEGAARRAANHARERLVRAGEGAALVAEQLAIEQVAGHGGAVERDEPRRAALRALMHGAGEQLLAGAGLAGDEHGDVAGRHSPRHAHQIEHRLGRADEAQLLFGQRIGPDCRALALGEVGGVQRAGAGDEPLQGQERDPG